MNKLKRKILILFTLIFLILLVSCNQTTTTTLTTTTQTTTTTKQLTTTTKNLSCKAINYEYDVENLNYELVWSDEFDGDALDMTKWAYHTGGSGFGNNELQYYTAGDNLKVENGLLIIEARKEQYQNNQYTSSKIWTRGKAQWLYGKFEIRAKLPSGRGTWPAFWMMPFSSSYGNWPNSGEIDIMEHVGYDMNRIHGSVHTQKYYHKIGTQKTAQIYVQDVDTEFHVYSIEWLPDRIDFYVDGRFYFRFKPSNFVSCPTKAEWPFDKSFYLIINLAIGGDWGGARGIDDSIFPQTLEVDYVRIYQSELIKNLQQTGGSK